MVVNQVDRKSIRKSFKKLAPVAPEVHEVKTTWNLIRKLSAIAARNVTQCNEAGSVWCDPPYHLRRKCLRRKLGDQGAGGASVSVMWDGGVLLLICFEMRLNVISYLKPVLEICCENWWKALYRFPVTLSFCMHLSETETICLKFLHYLGRN